MTEWGDAASDLAGASNVLILSPAFHPGKQDACANLLGPAGAAGGHVVGVTYARSAKAWLENFLEHATKRPRRVTVVSVGEQPVATDGGPAKAEDPADDSSLTREGVHIKTINEAADLTELGIVLSQIIEDHRGGERDDDLTLCYDSITALLQFVEMERAFRFLHVMSSRLDQSGVAAHYHLDPEAHDGQTVATLKSLFDAVVTVDDGGVDVQLR